MELTCISSEFPELLDKAVSNVTVTIDNKNIVISGHTYEYVADPEVTEIQPHISFAAYVRISHPITLPKEKQSIVVLKCT